MRLNWSRSRATWVVVVAVFCTAVVVVAAMVLGQEGKSVTRRLDHRFAIADSQFHREMSVMLGPSIVDGNSVTALQNGAEVFPAMLSAIAGAQSSITFETYIYWSGEVGAAFTDALATRARAGIPVQVTVDWAGSVKAEQTLLDQLTEAGVRLQRYRPLRWYNLGRFNNRTHRKLLIVDGRVAFTGGIGIADHWQGNASDSGQWRDSHFRIEGPVVAQFQAAFNDNWIKTTGQVLSGPEYFPALAPVGTMAAQLFIASPAGGSESMHLMYLMAIAAASRTIDVAASYFVPDEMLLEAIVAARRRHVRVRILLPGPHIDSETVRITSKGQWGPLLQAGAEIYIYQPTMMHSKVLIVDGELVSVGSTNFDLRSFRLNDEASLNIFDRGFAAQLTTVFEADLLQSLPFSYQEWKDRPLWEKVTERLIRPIKSQL